MVTRRKRIGFVAMSGIRVCDEALLELGLTLPGFVERSKAMRFAFARWPAMPAAVRTEPSGAFERLVPTWEPVGDRRSSWDELLWGNTPRGVRRLLMDELAISHGPASAPWKPLHRLG